MIAQQQAYNSRNYIIAHPNILSSPKGILTSTTPVRQIPPVFKPLIQNPQPHLIQGAQQTGHQSQKIIL